MKAQGILKLKKVYDYLKFASRMTKVQYIVDQTHTNPPANFKQMKEYLVHLKNLSPEVGWNISNPNNKQRSSPQK
jgi:hypothetical protein